MDRFAFIFTITFMLLGPVKLIPVFAGLTKAAEPGFKRSVAIWAVLIASGLCAFVVVAGRFLLDNYHISLAALRIAGGLVLLVAALLLTFQGAQTSSPDEGQPSAAQLAASPIAVPAIVPPAGVAAILLCVLLAPQFPGSELALAICLAIMMTLDFLVMYFIDQVLKMPGLTIVLTVLGAVLVFVQVCLAIEVILGGLKELGVLNAQG